MVHNLGLVAWDKLNQLQYDFECAYKTNDKMKKFILNINHQPRIYCRSRTK